VELKICVVGLGYVGLPLAVEFSSHFETIGLDVDARRIEELGTGFDRTGETSRERLSNTPRLRYTTTAQDAAECNVFIVTVPTPVDEHKKPDLRPLISASRSVGKLLKRGDIVVYESTVYPGCTEEQCVPELEKASGLKFNEDFFCGYSPERINPGDKVRTLPNIVKITSGSTPETAETVDRMYRTIVIAGTHKAPNLKVAEAAKVIENAQRDLNIAFVNELAFMFNRMGIDTLDVLEAAGTKWNFLNFRPGLVGGHCIGVDPYYLVQKSWEVGYHPTLIFSGRQVNESVAKFVAERVVKRLIKNRCQVNGARILVLGVTFKENCPDIRNSRVIDILKELQDYGCLPEVVDPHANAQEVFHEYQVEIRTDFEGKELGTYDAVILAVSHQEFLALDLRGFGHANAVVYDVKGVLKDYDERL